VVRCRGDPARSALRFVLLNPGARFHAITKDAHSVVLAGGTLQPIDALVAELFGDLPSGKVDVFSCDHIVPRENLVAVSLDVGPSGVPLVFNFGKRSSPATIAELGRTLVNLVSITPDGMVVFFPSYHYENQVYQSWLADGVIAKIEQKKKFFRETRGGDGAQDILQAFTDRVLSDLRRAPPADSSPASSAFSQATSRGAVLSCVVGGRLSEGINFADHLARCVVVVGLPYAPPNDPVVRETMAYIAARRGTKAAGEAYYEGLCMRGVNQSIGRAIRHIGDYASIVLLDQRYGTPRVSTALPRWIRGSLTHHAAFGPAFRQLRQFHVNRLAAPLPAPPPSPTAPTTADQPGAR